MSRFDAVIDRRGTNSVKWDDAERIFGEPDILPLWVADMDFSCPPEVVEAVVKRAQHPIYGYPGKPKALFEAAKGWIRRRFGYDLKTEWMTAVPGVVPAIRMAIMAFTKPGDKVVIQPPIYPPFFSTVEDLGRRLVKNPLKVENGRYVMDFDDLKRKIDERTKMILLCSPHNPVGRVWTKDELLELGEIAVRHDLIVVADEIHSDLVYEKGAHTPFYALSESLADRCITFISGSKTFNLAGLFSSIAIAKNPKIMRAFKTAVSQAGLEHINLFGIEAMTAAYHHGDAWLDELNVYLKENAEHIKRFLSERVPEVKMTMPEATYLAWLDFRELGLDGRKLRNFLIREAKLGLNNGYDFGEEGEGFMRLNFGCPRSILDEALERLETAVHRLRAEKVR
jgi:cystathionine beta-lyase